MLSDCSFKNLYNSKSDNLIYDFYIPALSNSTNYDRISAYFDSKILKMYSLGLENIVKNNGHIRFIFSCQLTNEDYELMKKGYDIRIKVNSILNKSLLDIDLDSDFSNLAYLIAYGYADIKIAFTKEGIFHDKFGLFHDNIGNSVYFRGSNNETVASVISNYESFETSLSWNCDFNELEKIRFSIDVFEKIWDNRFDGLIVTPLPDCVKERIVNCRNENLVNSFELHDNSIIFDITKDKEFCVINVLFDTSFFDCQHPFYQHIFRPYVSRKIDNQFILSNLTYLSFQNIIEVVKKKSIQYGYNVFITDGLRRYIDDIDILIDKRKSLGIAIKHRDPILSNDFQHFHMIIDDEMQRKLVLPQTYCSYHIVRMISSANFSVPGSGKTAIVFGAFAYLTHEKLIDKLVMIGPKNSFMAWKSEFKKCFGNKRILNCLDIQEDSDYDSKQLTVKYDYKGKNLILINYEAVQNLVDELSNIINSKTLLVFDEVHRIKAIGGARATKCLELSKNAKYKVVLSGTPIPNGYLDIFNFLNILYTNEYDYFFGFSSSYLKNSNNDENKVNEINNKLFPFFCRITKRDLNVPPPQEDDISSGYIEMNAQEIEIMKIVYRNFSSNSLLLFVRLQQAASNPFLLLKKINIDDFSDDSNDNDDNQDVFNDLTNTKIILSENDIDYISHNAQTRKIDKCVELIRGRIDNNESVVAWGIFIDSMNLLSDKLTQLGIQNYVINGSVPQRERDILINSFCNKDYKVLITNPHTLAESISLHQVCHYAVYFEYDFNLTHMVQSRDRIHRLGLLQDQKTEYSYIVLNSKNSQYNSIDFKIYKRLKLKEKLMINAVENDDICVENDNNYTEDIKAILSIE